MASDLKKKKALRMPIDTRNLQAYKYIAYT